MKYNISTLQTLQQALEDLKEREFWCQLGICRHVARADPENYKLINKWVAEKYKPNVFSHIEYWWPISIQYSDEVLEQSWKDRIAFLEQVIENIMCGE